MTNYPLLCSSNVCSILRRAPRPLQPLGSRAFHLIHHLFGSEPNSLHELAGIRRAQYPPGDSVSLRLRHAPDHEPTTMTLSEALEKLQPCSYLSLTELPTEARLGLYCIKTFKSPQLIKKSRKVGPGSLRYYKRGGKSKESRLTTDCDDLFLRHQLGLAYNFLVEGSRMEFHLRQRTKNKLNTVQWSLSHRMDLRPDSILAAMPRGTTMLALPGYAASLPEGRRPRTRYTMESVFWALENAPALRKLNSITPKKVKQFGTWSTEIKPPVIKERVYFPGFLRPQIGSDITPDPQGDLADLLESPDDDSDETSAGGQVKKSRFQPFVSNSKSK